MRRTISRSSIRPRPSLTSRVRKTFCATLRVEMRLNSWKIMAMPARPGVLAGAEADGLTVHLDAALFER